MKQPLTPLLRNFFGFLKKDYYLLYKRKKYLYIFLLLPLVIASLFLFALNTSDYTIKVGVCDFDNTELSKGSFTDLNGFDTTILAQENCLNNLISGIGRGNFDLGMEIGKGFTQNIENLKQGKIIVYYDNTDLAFSNLVSWKVDQSMQPFERQVIDKLNTEVKQKLEGIREGVDILFEYSGKGRIKNLDEADKDLRSLEEMETEFLVNPIWTDKRGIYQDVGKSLGIVFIFPVLALFVILMLSSTSIIYDKKNGYLTRTKSSSSIFLYILAKVLFFVTLVLAQFLIIWILFLIYGASYSFQIPEIIKLIFYIGAIDSLIGLLIGIFSENEGIAVLFSLVVSFPLMLVSGLFFPIQTMPKIIQLVAKVLPLEFQIQAAKSVMLFNQGISNNWVWGIIALFIIAWIIIRKKG